MSAFSTSAFCSAVQSGWRMAPASMAIHLNFASDGLPSQSQVRLHSAYCHMVMGSKPQ